MGQAAAGKVRRCRGNFYSLKSMWPLHSGGSLEDKKSMKRGQAAISLSGRVDTKTQRL